MGDFDDLRIKLIKLYIKRYQNEEGEYKQNVERLENETKNIEDQLTDYISNRNQLLLDIQRILNQLNSDSIDLKKYTFIPRSYTENLPVIIQEKYNKVSQELNEKNVSDLLRNQIQKKK